YSPPPCYVHPLTPTLYALPHSVYHIPIPHVHLHIRLHPPPHDHSNHPTTPQTHSTPLARSRQKHHHKTYPSPLPSYF
ncbi:hypothetical protein HELRODRAFT_124806, partial [Helobdella robusta]|uniref:Uncharacterized protein n=1 Tax=Helobdella robusta TaxID=6412 RepID=T1EH29_HELRO